MQAQCGHCDHFERRHPPPPFLRLTLAFLRSPASARSRHRLQSHHVSSQSMRKSLGTAGEVWCCLSGSGASLREHGGRAMLIYLFRDESDNDICDNCPASIRKARYGPTFLTRRAHEVHAGSKLSEFVEPLEADRIAAVPKSSALCHKRNCHNTCLKSVTSPASASVYRRAFGSRLASLRSRTSAEMRRILPSSPAAAGMTLALVRSAKPTRGTAA